MDLDIGLLMPPTPTIETLMENVGQIAEKTVAAVQAIAV